MKSKKTMLFRLWWQQNITLNALHRSGVWRGWIRLSPWTSTNMKFGQNWDLNDVKQTTWLFKCMFCLHLDSSTFTDHRFSVIFWCYPWSNSPSWIQSISGRLDDYSVVSQKHVKLISVRIIQTYSASHFNKQYPVTGVGFCHLCNQATSQNSDQELRRRIQIPQATIQIQIQDLWWSKSQKRRGF